MTSHDAMPAAVARRRLSETGPGRLSASAHADRVHCVAPGEVKAWLAAAWEDLKAAALPSMSLGFIISALAFVALLAPRSGQTAELSTALGIAFMVVLPLLAVGFFYISRWVETGQPVRFLIVLLAWTASPLRLLAVGLTLALAFLAWQRASMLLFALATPEGMPAADAMMAALVGLEAWPFLVGALALAAVVAFVLFALGIVAVPLMFERRVDPLTALHVAGLAALANPRAVAAWAGLCTLIVAAGALVGIIGLAFTLPLSAHGTWHAYRSLVHWEE